MKQTQQLEEPTQTHQSPIKTQLHDTHKQTAATYITAHTSDSTVKPRHLSNYSHAESTAAATAKEYIPNKLGFGGVDGS